MKRLGMNIGIRRRWLMYVRARKVEWIEGI